MLVETVIKDNATYLTPTPDFQLASMDWFNDSVDIQTVWPVLLMENITPAKPVVTTAGITQYVYDVSLFFLHNYPANDEQDLNHSPEFGGDRHVAVDTMRMLAGNLLDALVKDSRLYKPTEDITGAVIRSVYNFLDMNLDGVQLTFSLRLLQSPSCPPKHDGPLITP